MPQETLLLVMAGAVIVSAIALVAQAFMVFGMFKAIQALRTEVSAFVPKAEKFLASSEAALKESQQQIREVTARTTTILDTTQKQLVRFDDVFGDASVRIKTQMERLELVLDDTVTRVHQTVVHLNNGVMRPIKEVNGIAAGLGAAVQAFFRGNRPNPAQATSDEEMFI